MDAGNGKLMSSEIGIIELPKFPEDVDWGLKLIYEGPRDKSQQNKVLANESQLKKNIKKMVYVAATVLIILLVSLLIHNLS